MQCAVPRDVHLLPGQLKDIVEAIGDFQSTPPPLPTLPRPRMAPPASNGNWSGSSGGSNASGSFRGHLTYRGEAPPKEGDGTIGNIKQLNRRQADLAFKSLSTEVEHNEIPPAADDYGDYSTKPQPNPGIWSEFSFGAPTLQNENNRRRDANQNYASNANKNKDDDDGDTLNPNPQEGPVRPLLPPQFRLDKNPGAAPPAPPPPFPGSPVRAPPSPTYPTYGGSTYGGGSTTYGPPSPDVQRVTSEFTAPRHPPTSPTTDPEKTFDARSQQNPGMSLRAVYK